MVPAPFQIQVAEEVLMDLRQRLARTRWPDSLPDAGWDYGTNLAYLRLLVDYWRESYDWRAWERLLNSFPSLPPRSMASASTNAGLWLERFASRASWLDRREVPRLERLSRRG